MAEIQIQSGHTIIEKGQPLTTLCLIMEGSVSLDFPLGSVRLGPGDAIGLLDLLEQSHSCTYTAITDVVVEFYPFSHIEAFCRDIIPVPSLTKAFCDAALMHISHVRDTYEVVKYECDSLYSALMQYYKEYTRLCQQYTITPKLLPGLGEVHPLSTETDIDGYIGRYYQDMKQIFSVSLFETTFCKSGFLEGFLMRACEDMHKIMNGYEEMTEYLSELSSLLINEDGLDFLDLYSSMLVVTSRRHEDTLAITSAIGKLFLRADNAASIDQTLYQQRLSEYQDLVHTLEQETTDKEMEDMQNALTLQNLTGSLSQILDFAQVDTAFRTEFLRQIASYKNEPDKADTSESATQLRKNLTKGFLHLYTEAFFRSMEQKQLPPILKMFFYFGYIDEQLCGTDNALQLFSKCHFLSKKEEPNVFLLYDWLTLIYTGAREPHKDEFDRDFPSYIQSLENEGTISREEAAGLLQDTAEKVRFEIENLVACGMKITSGNPASFCPILSEHNFIKSPASVILGKPQVAQALSSILELDFSAYHREVMFSDATLGSQHEFVQSQVLPEFILLPGIGMRGALWQEIEGAKRQTPACMLLPILCMTDINLIMLRLTGEFRWEMCKRMTGSRWNDVTYPSLTSEYTDYLQFYKRNNALSPEARQKCKQQLARVRNRFKESFLIDYIAWILFESKGSPRLNKVARQIFATYCPFPKDTREELKKNPLYTKLLEQYESHKNKELTRINSVIFRVKRNNRNYCPDALLKQADFLEQ